MREIKFRGRHKYIGEWFYGDYVHGNTYENTDLLIPAKPKD